MKHIFIILIALILTTAGCRSGQTDEPKGELKKRYEFRGKVVSVDRAARKAEIDHEEIPGFMPPMTMTFPIKEDWVWDDLLPGVGIRAELVVDNTADEPYWLEKIGIIGAPDPGLPQPAETEPKQIGQTVPAVTLTDQDGKRISTADYKGKALAITFIYAECPLPDACIKMSQQFSDLAIQLNSSEEYRDNVRLLSISFDPQRDTPAKLRQYGIGYLGNPEKPDFTVWNLAVGEDKEVRKLADFFGLQYSVDDEDKAVINHNLVTAVISPEGKVVKLLPGNRWSSEELMLELRKALQSSAN
jgi:protein SCO1/2